VFAVIDVGFFLSNIVKVFDGGWASLVVASRSCWCGHWVRGSRLLFEKTRKNEIPLDFLADNLAKKPPHLVQGTAVFLTGDPQSAPTALMHSLKHYKVLHKQNVILSVVTAPQPIVHGSERVQMEPINDLFMRVTSHLRLYGAAEHSQGAGYLPQAGLEVRHHDDVISSCRAAR
jgi:KUP system potassium uptake protein